MKRFILTALFGLWGIAAFAQDHPEVKVRRIVILKIDGLTGDLLYRTMREADPATGKSRLPWFSHIFAENGVVFENFYTRGISLSAPSWSMLDTGQHTVIRGNVEYDRYTGRVYDYLNFFPFYIGYARKRQIDMPGVEVLDRAGIPLVLDAFPYDGRYQGFQLFQRGVRWTTLRDVLTRRVKSELFLSPVESVGAPSMDSLLGQQTERELKDAAEQPDVFYLDIFNGDADHVGHATNQQAALTDVLRHLDGLAGRIWTTIEKSSLARQTIFVVVSDHGMNNRPDVFSQGYSLPDFFNSPAGGAHHVVTNRHQLDSYKIMGLNPLVQRVVTPSTASFYLGGKASSYPTAWLDLDGNERTAVHLRNSDLNKIHVLLLQLMRTDLTPEVRQAAVSYLLAMIERHRAAWTKTASEMDEELAALQVAIDGRKAEVKELPRKWSKAEWEKGSDKEARRERRDLELWEQEYASYSGFLKHLRVLMALHLDADRPFHGNVSDYVPEMELGDNNSVGDLQHYVVGPGPSGLVIGFNGKLDEERSFRFVNYFPTLVQQRVRNNPQSTLPVHPVDFIAMRLPDEAVRSHQSGAVHGYWLYRDENSQVLVLTDAAGRIALRPVSHLGADGKSQIQWTPGEWCAGLPLRLFEDDNLHLPSGADRAQWLSDWHTDREWLLATHQCHYSNGVIGITEELSPVEDNVPASPDRSPMSLRYERRRRALVAADFHIFAADGWNF
ncbi:MAG: alkaline phosphatase family protein, partial [Acidobacteriaceae bacterium]|nr:alkaline phosphatase family protein [Acidobacteriaceae bacterium]